MKQTQTDKLKNDPYLLGNEEWWVKQDKDWAWIQAQEERYERAETLPAFGKNPERA